MKLYKDYYSKFFLLISLGILVYILFRSEIYWEGSQRGYYKNYYSISIIIIIFSCITFIIRKKIKIYLSIFFISSLLSLYLFESFLISQASNLLSKKEKIFFQKLGKKIDKRSKIEIFEILKIEDETVKVVASPHYYMNKKNLKIFPLSGVSSSKTVNCNENGYYSIFNSDRFGYNNPDSEWDKIEIEYMLIGDSFAKGSCVNNPDDIASILRKLSSKSTVTTGYNSKGPLMGLASLKEYISPKVKKIIWLYFEGNDIYNLEKELKNDFLLQYLMNDEFSQNLKDRQNEIDQLANELMIRVLDKKKGETELFNSLSYKFVNFIKLYKTRQMVSAFFSNKPSSTAEYEFTDAKVLAMEKILKKAVQISILNDAEFYFVYLPAYERYVNKIDNYNYNKIRDIVDKLNIDFIDINKEVFSKTFDPLNFFPFKMNGHYNELGYLETAKIIYQNTK